jgi:hypothetical protein
LDGNEERTSTATNASPTWADAVYEFPILDPSSDLCLFLFDDKALTNETCIGRIIVPLCQLCKPPLLMQPKPQHTSWFHLQPATKQNSSAPQELYEVRTHTLLVAKLCENAHAASSQAL